MKRSLPNRIRQHELQNSVIREHNAPIHPCYITRILILCLLFQIVSQSGSAQKTEKNELDGKYSPPKGSIFDESKSSESRGSSDIQNALLFEPFLIPRGVLAATFRKQLPRTPISLMASLGAIIAKDEISSAFSESYESESGVESEIPLSSIYPSATLTSGNRIFAQCAIRISIDGSEDLSDDSGIELGIRFHNLSLKPSQDSDDFMTISANSIDINTKTFFVQWSRVSAPGNGHSPFTHAFTAGIGYKVTKYDALVGYSANSEFENIDQYYVPSGEKARFGHVSLLMSYSLGIGW